MNDEVLNIKLIWDKDDTTLTNWMQEYLRDKKQIDIFDFTAQVMNRFKCFPFVMVTDEQEERYQKRR